MKNLLLSILFVLISFFSQAQTDIIIKNSSNEDSVKVYVTLQSDENVVGLFGIKKSSSANCKGNFWAKKNVEYHLNRTTEVAGAIVSFRGDNQNCKSAINNGFPTGVNNFEFTVNTENKFETLDISCVDGVNSIIKYSVSDGWNVGLGDYLKTFKSTQNKYPLSENCNVEGVFPYQCTDCIDVINPPSKCFGDAVKCTSNRICQVNRYDKIGGHVLVEYLGGAK